MSAVLIKPREYDPLAVMGQRLVDDCYVLDLTRNGVVIAARAPYERMRLGENFLSAMLSDDRVSLHAYLMDYQTAPVLLDTKFGIGIVIPALMPNAALALVLLPRLSRDALLSLISREPHTSFLWSDGLRKQIPQNPVRISEADESAFFAFSKNVELCFGSLGADAPFGEELLRQRLYALSSFCGCPISLSVRNHLTQHGEFNPSLFTAFSLISLLLCRRLSLSREASVELENHPTGISVSFRILCPSEDIFSAPELLWLQSLADRKRLIFESTVLPQQLHLRLIPTDSDWARLGIKQPDEYGFLRHAPWTNDEKSQSRPKIVAKFRIDFP